MARTRRQRRIHKRNRRVALGLAIALILGAGLVAAIRHDTGRKVVASAGGEGTETTSAGVVAPTTTAPVPGMSYIATARVPNIDVYDTAGASTPVRSFANPWFINDDPKLPVPLVFSVRQQQDDGWIEVLLPTRPNSSTGWVHAADVALSVTKYRIAIALGAHLLQVFDGESVMLESTVAVGAPATPTPVGDYYVVALLKAPNPNTVYGPYAYGLSGHSEVLETFAGGDAEVGIHGNNDSSVLGKDVSHGCVRMSNDDITRLAGVLPLGTPVTISA